MKAMLLQEQAEKTYAVVFDKGDEVMAGLLGFATRNKLAGSHFTAIGAFSDATLAYVDRNRKDYQRIRAHEADIVPACVGNRLARSLKRTFPGDARQVERKVWQE